MMWERWKQDTIREMLPCLLKEKHWIIDFETLTNNDACNGYKMAQYEYSWRTGFCWTPHATCSRVFFGRKSIKCQNVNALMRGSQTTMQLSLSVEIIWSEDGSVETLFVYSLAPLVCTLTRCFLFKRNARGPSISYRYGRLKSRDMAERYYPGKTMGLSIRRSQSRMKGLISWKWCLPDMFRLPRRFPYISHLISHLELTRQIREDLSGSECASVRMM